MPAPALVKRDSSPDASAIERVLIGGDLSILTPEQRVAYYNRVCESLGLNPLTKPFAYLKLNGKETLYALRDAAEQLRKLHGVSIVEILTQKFDDVYVVTAKAQDRSGRTDASTGAVPLGSLRGEALANAMMKAETKAKRRVTLSICGLGMLDETEVESIPAARTSLTVEAPIVSTEPNGMAVKVPASEPPSAVLDPVGQSAPDRALRIQRVETRPTSNKNVTKYVIVLSDGREVTTIKQQLSALAEACCQAGDPVTVETKTTKWGEDLVSLHRAERVIQLRADEVREPGSDDDLAF